MFRTKRTNDHATICAGDSLGNDGHSAEHAEHVVRLAIKRVRSGGIHCERRRVAGRRVLDRTRRVRRGYAARDRTAKRRMRAEVALEGNLRSCGDFEAARQVSMADVAAELHEHLRTSGEVVETVRIAPIEKAALAARCRIVVAVAVVLVAGDLTTAVRTARNPIERIALGATRAAIQRVGGQVDFAAIVWAPVTILESRTACVSAHAGSAGTHRIGRSRASVATHAAIVGIGARVDTLARAVFGSGRARDRAGAAPTS